MEQKFKIAIPEPCQENWDKMTPNENGRFCISCSKTVIDFSIMSDNQIQDFFIKNQGKNICGRFKNKQLDALIIQIPSYILYSQNHYHKMFLLALFITMGTTLFSCQDKEGNKTKIDKIEIVHDSTEKVSNKDSLKINPDEKPIYPKYEQRICQLPPPENGVDGNSYVESYTAGGISLSCYVEIQPNYPGGFEKFSEFIKNEFQIPKKAKRTTGEIEVSFVIDKVGTLNQIKVFDNIGHETGEEIIRVLQKSEKWSPGEIYGKRIDTAFRLNIVVEKDSLNPERKKRKLSKIISLKIADEKKESISLVN